MTDLKARRTMARVHRSAKALTHGEEILQIVIENKDLLVEGANEGIPPVSKISKILLQKHRNEAKLLPVRQFVGSAVKAVLGLEGYTVASTGIRIPKDEVFKTGATYERVQMEDDEEEGDDLEETFVRMVDGLTTREKRLLLKVLEAALG